MKMSRLALILCAVYIFSAMYFIFVGGTTDEYFGINIALCLFTLYLLVIACMINVNGF